MGRNPATGETIQIAASKGVGFKAGKSLEIVYKLIFKTRPIFRAFYFIIAQCLLFKVFEKAFLLRAPQ